MKQTGYILDQPQPLSEAAIEDGITSVLMRLRRARKIRRLSQGEVADLLGVTRTTVTAWEVGMTGLTVDMLFRLCNLYGCSPVWAITGLPTALEQERAFASAVEFMHDATQNLYNILKINSVVDDEEIEPLDLDEADTDDAAIEREMTKR